MSAELRNRIASDVASICQEPEARRKLEAAGHNVLEGTTEELKRGIAKQRAWLGEVTKIVDIEECAIATAQKENGCAGLRTSYPAT